MIKAEFMSPQESYQYYDALYGGDAKLGLESIELADKLCETIMAVSSKLEDFMNMHELDSSQEDYLVEIIEQLDEVLP